MECKKIGYEVQRLEVTLHPGESFYAERGAMIYCESGITSNVETSGNGLGGIIRSKLSGESVFIVNYQNLDSRPHKMLLSSSANAVIGQNAVSLPAAILPIKLNNEEIFCGRGRYVASVEKVRLSLNISIPGLTSGLGFLQKICGNGTIFLASLGMPIEIDLSLGQRMEVDEKHVVAMQGIRDNQLHSHWAFKNVIGGEGLSLLEVTGPGKLFLN